MWFNRVTRIYKKVNFRICLKNERKRWTWIRLKLTLVY